jgi:hypothetical protein
MTLAYGMVRPIIGGIFGMTLFVLLEGGLVPAIEITTDSELPFYAAVGFLAGFNERWAQDMLAGSARRLGAGLAEDETPPATPRPLTAKRDPRAEG